MKDSTTSRNKKKIFLTFVSILSGIVIWAIAAAVIGKPVILPSPYETLKSILLLIREPEFIQALSATILRVFLGVTVAFVIGVILGIIAGLNESMYDLINPFFSVMRPVPVASVIILINLWVHSDLVSVVVVFLICTPIIWANTVTGIKKTDKDLLEVGKIYNVPKSRILRDIYIPSVVPYVTVAFLSCVGLSWKVTITAEILANVLPSVGMEVYYSKIYLETESLFAWTVVIVVLSYAVELLIKWVLKKVDKTKLTEV
jgi:NitT/TauT family transport system permease protein